VAAYQQSVLNADQEVENGIVTFLKGQERTQLLRESVDAAYTALEVVIAQYENPTTIAGAGADFNRYAVILQNLILQQEQWAAARGQIALGLIQTYRALGGGWQIRCRAEGGQPGVPTTPETNPSTAPEEIPMPNQELLPTPPSTQATEKPMDGTPVVPQTPAPLTPPASANPFDDTPPAPSTNNPLDATPSSSAPATAPEPNLTPPGPCGCADITVARSGEFAV